MKSKRKLVILVLAFLAAGAIFLGWRQWHAAAVAAAKNLVLYGNVDIRHVDLSFRVSGRIEEMRVEEGDSVKAGQAIACLDRKPYEDSVRLADAQVAQAKAALAKLEAGYRSEEIEQAKATVAQREAVVKLAQLNFDRTKSLNTSKIVAQQTLDEVTANLKEAESLLKAAKDALALLVKGYRSEDIDAARASLLAAEAQLAQAGRSLSDADLIAPSDGTIETRITEPGTMVSAGQSAYTLSLKNPVWIRAYVEEPGLGRIHPGMKVKVQTDSAPDKPYVGQIGFISPEAEFTPKTVETEALRTSLVYRLRIVVENPDDGLRQGMPVTVYVSENK